jgi:hypothetical protein
LFAQRAATTHGEISRPALRRGHIFHTAKGIIVLGLGYLVQAPGGDVVIEDLAEEFFPEPGEHADVVVPPVPPA